MGIRPLWYILSLNKRLFTDRFYPKFSKSLTGICTDTLWTFKAKFPAGTFVANQQKCSYASRFSHSWPLWLICLIQLSSDFDEYGVKLTGPKCTVTFYTYLVITVAACNPGIKTSNISSSCTRIPIVHCSYSVKTHPNRYRYGLSSSTSLHL